MMQVVILPTSRLIVSLRPAALNWRFQALSQMQNPLRTASRSDRSGVLPGSSCSRGIARSSGLRRDPGGTGSAQAHLHSRGRASRKFFLGHAVRGDQAPGAAHSSGSRTRPRFRNACTPRRSVSTHRPKHSPNGHPSNCPLRLSPAALCHEEISNNLTVARDQSTPPLSLRSAWYFRSEIQGLLPGSR